MIYSFMAAADPAAQAGIGGMLLSMSPILLVFVAMYFIMIRPQRKKEKAATEMRNAIEVGDGVTTIGGIVGRVASIKEDTFVIETGTDRVKMRFKRWAIQDVEKLNIEATATPAEEKKA